MIYDGRKTFFDGKQEQLELCMRNASQSNLNSSKFRRRWDLNENGVTSESQVPSPCKVEGYYCE